MRRAYSAALLAVIVVAVLLGAFLARRAVYSESISDFVPIVDRVIVELSRP